MGMERVAHSWTTDFQGGETSMPSCAVWAGVERLYCNVQRKILHEEGASSLASPAFVWVSHITEDTWPWWGEYE